MLRKLRSYPMTRTVLTSLVVARMQFKLRTEGSVLGVFWYVLEPLLVFGVLLLISQIISIDHPHYAPYLFLGLIMYNLFVQATSGAATAIITHRESIKWTKVSSEIFPLAQVLQFCLSHLVELALLLIIILFSGLSPTGLLLYPLIFLPFGLFIIGVSLLLCVATVYTRDVVNAWRILTGRLLWLGTPIFYVLTEGSWLWYLNQFNPLYYFLTLARTITVDQTLPSFSLVAITLTISIAVFLVGLYTFIRYKPLLADQL